MFNLFKKNYFVLSMSKAKENIDNDPSTMIIDVRTPAEYKSGHIPKAVNIPLDKADKIKSLFKNMDTTCIPDVKTVKNLITDMDFLKYGTVKLVMDRGFYSEANINALYQNHLKFLMGTKISLKWVRKELDPVRDTMRTRANYQSNYELNYHTAIVSWD